MNIYTVRDNLLQTIKGKEAYLANMPNLDDLQNWEARSAAIAVRSFLKINLDELYGILSDVQICCKQATEASWQGVDRQGGI